MRLAILADTHYNSSKQTNCGGARHTGIADKLVRQAVALINETIKPDVTILLGDLADEAEPNDLRVLKNVLDDLDSKVIAIPGNHDGDPDQFYSIFPKPDPIVEIGETRFVVHVDEERPGYNAWRSPEDIPLERQARNNWQGDVVSLQHVPVFPPGETSCPYHYVNIEDIIKTLEESKTTLVISAHFHPGIPPLCHNQVTYMVVPALCEGNFPVTVVDISKGNVKVREINLR